MFKVPNKYRVRAGRMVSDDSCGNNGAFLVPVGLELCFVIASDGLGWQHVSASFQGRVPTWMEMCVLKDLFWDEEDTVMQLHPPKSEYINCHPNVLHLWRPLHQDIPKPPGHLVGPKQKGEHENIDNNTPSRDLKHRGS